MKQLKSIIWILILAFISTTFLFDGCGKKDDGKVKIGAIIPLTGQSSAYGVQMKNGITLWQKNHPNSKIKVIIEDGQAVPNISLTVFSSLVNNQKIQAVITGFSGVVLSLAPVANRDKIVLINGGATNPNIKRSGEYIFNVIPDAEIEAKYLSHFIIDSLKRNECFIYWQNNDAGKGMRDYFLEDFQNLGGKVIGELSHNINQTDFKNDLLRIKNSKSKIVFVPTYSKDMGLILRQAANLGLKDILWIGYAATETKDLLDLTKGLINGKVVYSYYEYDINSITNNSTRDFMLSYQKEFNTVPGLYSATFYDAISLLDLAVENGNFNGQDIKKFLYKIDDFAGVTGKLKFGGKNYITSGLRMKMIYNDNFVEFDNSKLEVNY